MALRFFVLCLLWLRPLNYNFVVAQVAVSQRLCLWPQLETKTITCSADGSSLIFIKSIVMTRLLGGLTTCATASSNDAPEINDCRVTLGSRDSYYIDTNRLCADKPSCNIHGNGNVAAYIGQSLCGFGMENSTIRNLVILTVQCYAVQILPATTASTTTTTKPRPLTSTNPMTETQTAAGQFDTGLSKTISPILIDKDFLTTKKLIGNRREEIASWASFVFVSSSGVSHVTNTVRISLGLAAFCLARMA